MKRILVLLRKLILIGEKLIELIKKNIYYKLIAILLFLSFLIYNSLFKEKETEIEKIELIKLENEFNDLKFTSNKNTNPQYKYLEPTALNRLSNKKYLDSLLRFDIEYNPIKLLCNPYYRMSYVKKTEQNKIFKTIVDEKIEVSNDYYEILLEKGEIKNFTYEIISLDIYQLKDYYHFTLNIENKYKIVETGESKGLILYIHKNPSYSAFHRILTNILTDKFNPLVYPNFNICSPIVKKEITLLKIQYTDLIGNDNTQYFDIENSRNTYASSYEHYNNSKLSLDELFNIKLENNTFEFQNYYDTKMSKFLSLNNKFLMNDIGVSKFNEVYTVSITVNNPYLCAEEERTGHIKIKGKSVFE